MLNGGKIIVSGVGSFSPAGSPMKYFAQMSNTAQVSTYGFNGLGGNISTAFGH
jgi:hypothetical protein